MSILSVSFEGPQGFHSVPKEVTHDMDRPTAMGFMGDHESQDYPWMRNCYHCGGQPDGHSEYENCHQYEKEPHQSLDHGGQDYPWLWDCCSCGHQPDKPQSVR